MTTPKVHAILIAAQEKGPIRRLEEVIAVAGKGLEGDRYFERAVTAGGSKPSEEITLIELEGVEAADAGSDIDIGIEDTRRNIVTEGVDLRSLIGTTFTVGEVEIEALEYNPPCNYLQKVTGKKLMKPLIDRGGVRGRIVRGGAIRVGDEIVTH